MQIGEIFDEKFEIINLLGEGATSKVYKVRNLLLDEYQVLKILKAEMLEQKNVYERFKKEAKLTIQLAHPNIVRMKSFGISKDSLIYIVMELIEGESLDEIIQVRKKLSTSETISIGIQIAQALDYAHKHSLIHRDIKPGNILISHESCDAEEQDDEPEMANDRKKLTARVLDFGLAKDISAEDKNSALTKTSFFMGTPNYMSPEQCKMQAADSRSDIYSLGIVLYECLMGKPPFSADNDLSIMNKHINESASFSDDCNTPMKLQLAILKCLEKEADLRYQTAKELENDLLQINPYELNKNQRKTSKQSLVSIKSLVLVSILFICLILVSTYYYMRPKATDFIQKQTKQKTHRVLGLNELPLEHYIELAREAKDQTSRHLPNYQLAIDIYRKAMEVAKRQKRMNAYCKFYKEIAECYKNLEDHKNAEINYALAVSEAKKYCQNAPAQIAELLKDYAYYHRAVGKNELALEEVDKALKLVPEGQTHGLRAKILLQATLAARDIENWQLELKYLLPAIQEIQLFYESNDRDICEYIKFLKQPYFMLKNKAKFSEACQQQLDITVNITGRHSQDCWDWLIEEAEWLKKENEYAWAKKYCQAIINSRECNNKIKFRANLLFAQMS